MPQGGPMGPVASRFVRPLAVLALVCSGLTAQAQNATVTGTIVGAGSGTPVVQARVTLFTPNLSFFRETRSNSSGSYAIANVPAGSYRLGVAARGLEYVEQQAVLASGANTFDVSLALETHPGAWAVIGDTLPEIFDATDIGALRPDGFVMFCHNTVDPILFNPATGQKILGPSSGS